MSKLLMVLNIISGVLGALVAPQLAQAQSPPTEAQCLTPGDLAMAQICEANYRLCTKAPNDEWRGKWRIVCGVPAGSYLGSVRFDGGSGLRALQAVAEVRWSPKPGSKNELVPSGTLTVSGTSAKCAAKETVPITQADGALEVSRSADGKVTQYRGYGMKMVAINIRCDKAAGSRPLPVAWFATGEALQAAKGAALEGKLISPPGSPGQWQWRFTP